MNGLLPNTKPPYYAVIFTSRHTGADQDEYGVTANQMAEMASQQPGYLGINSTSSSPDPLTGARSGITVSYWQTEEDVRNWKKVVEHRGAQRLGREKWYAKYATQVCRVERHYQFEKGGDGAVEQV